MPVRGYDLAWSPDSRKIAYVDRDSVGLASVSGRVLRVIGQGEVPAWSPAGKNLAFESKDGLQIFSSRTGKTRLLTDDAKAVGGSELPVGLAWAPDGRSIAYIPGSVSYCCSSGVNVWNGDLRVVTLTGHTRTVVSADKLYGGRMLSLAWTRPPAALRYRPAEPAPGERTTTDGMLADGPVEFLAADGDRVAFATGCNTVSVWTLTAARVGLVRSSSPGKVCNSEDVDSSVTGLALARDAVAWVEVCCNNTKDWHVKQQSLDTPPRTFELGGGHGDADIAGPALGGGSHFDSPAGAGSLLVFSSWQSAWNSATSHYQVIWQSIVRARSAGCPCPTLRTDPGPLIIDDVDAGRIAAHGNNGVVVLDGSDGTQLSFITVKPAAAALSGGDLVVLVQGELRDYDWANGTLVHRWPLPNVAAGPDCPFGIYFGCPGDDEAELLLRLQDATHGLVAYVLEDQIHLLRLSDGTDKVVAAGNHARFMDTGLVYTDGSRLHLVPFDKLPLT